MLPITTAQIIKRTNRYIRKKVIIKECGKVFVLYILKIQWQTTN